MGLRRVLALKFQAGEMPIFIPWAAPRAAPTDNRSVSRATRSRRLPADFFLA
jgi:hypothetical protein